MHTEVIRNFVNLKGYSPKHLVLPTLLITLAFLAFFSAILVIALCKGQIPIKSKNDVAKAILGSTMSLSAMSLAVFGYSISQMKSARSTDAKRPYRRIGLLVYFVITLGLADALASAGYILFEDDLFFGISLLLFLTILYGVIGSVTLWAAKDL